MSIFRSAPYFYCYSLVAPPPLTAPPIFFWICFGVSVKKIPEFGFEADILVPKPCNEGKNFEYKPAGFGALSLPQTSLVILKYGSWSIPQGMRQGMFLLPKMCGKVDDRQGAAWMAGYAALPQQSLKSIPKMAFKVLMLMCFWNLQTLGYIVPIYSESMKIKVFSGSNPKARMSLIFS